jgi:hypothetical protein
MSATTTPTRSTAMDVKTKRLITEKKDVKNDQDAYAYMNDFVEIYKSATDTLQWVRVLNDPQEISFDEGPATKKRRLEDDKQQQQQAVEASKPKKWTIASTAMLLDQFRRFAIFQHDRERKTVTFKGFYRPYERDPYFEENQKKRALARKFIYIGPEDLEANLPGLRPTTPPAPIKIDTYCNLHIIGHHEGTPSTVGKRIQLLCFPDAEEHKAAVRLGDCMGFQEDVISFRTILRAFAVGSTQNGGGTYERDDRLVHSEFWVSREVALMQARLKKLEASFNVWEAYMRLTGSPTMMMFSIDTNSGVKLCWDSKTNAVLTMGHTEVAADESLSKCLDEFRPGCKEWLWINKKTAQQYDWLNEKKLGETYVVEDLEADPETGYRDAEVFVPKEVVAYSLAYRVFKFHLRDAIRSHQENNTIGIDGKSKLWTETLSGLCRVQACKDTKKCSVFSLHD